MMQPFWQKLLLQSRGDHDLWELFNENSKIGRHTKLQSDHEILKRMNELQESLSYEGHPKVDLPKDLEPLKMTFQEVVASRVSERNMTPCSLGLTTIATLLHYAYGVTRDNQGTSYPRPFRVVPSAGGLYPLELFFHGAQIEGLPPGIYHYNPIKAQLRLIRKDNLIPSISHAMIHPDIGTNSSLLIFVTAIFERSIFKYGERGYRFILLEAGHVAQNINLVATALGLGSVNIGGFVDREIDEILGIDGITHSTVYMIAVGSKACKACKQ